MKKIDIVVPCYNEQECIRLFYEKIKKVFEEIPGATFEILFIDDGSSDNTLTEIKRVEKAVGSERIKYISFSRNFGKESAMYVGLSKCSGDYIVVMDVDLQHPPELLKEMYSLLETEDYDCVTARRVSRKGEPVIRSACSRTFYKIYKRLTGIEMIQGSTDYRMMKRKVADAIVSMSERERFTKGIYSWIGFKNKWIEYENVERAAGKTKWSMRGLFKYAINGFVAFATTPLRSVIYLGMLVVAFSFIYAITLIITMLNSPATARTGYASIIILMLFLGGVIITILGVIGEYLARIYMEVKQRPIYIISESNIDEIPKNSI